MLTHRYPSAATMPSSSSIEPSQTRLPPPPAPIRYFDLLPNELVQQIVEHGGPIEYRDFKTYERRQADLRAACLTSRRLRSIAHRLLFAQMPSLTQLGFFSGLECIHGSLNLKNLQYLCLFGDESIDLRLDVPPSLPSLVALKCVRITSVQLDVKRWPAAFPSLRVLSLLGTDNLAVDQHFDRLMQQIHYFEVGFTSLTGPCLDRWGEKTLVVVDEYGRHDGREIAQFILKWTGLPPLFKNAWNCSPFQILSTLISSSSTSQPALPPILFLPSLLRETHYYERQACNSSLEDYPVFKEIDITWEEEPHPHSIDPRVWADDLREMIERRRAVLGFINAADGPAMA
ncbi:hypothetical protein JCM10212_000248 [Sporobolomyces blumeae]